MHLAALGPFRISLPSLPGPSGAVWTFQSWGGAVGDPLIPRPLVAGETP
jgi:hypothetical protein